MTTIPLLLSVALKGLVVLALAALATYVLRKAPASARHGVWAAAFGALLLLPVLEAVGPTWTVSVLPASATGATAPMPAMAPMHPLSPAHPMPFIGAGSQAEINAEVEAAMAEYEAEMAGFEAEMDGFEAEMEAYEAEMEAYAAENAFVFADAAPAAVGLWTSPLLWLLGVWAIGAVVVALGWIGAFLSAFRLVAVARPETDEEWAVLAEHARLLSGLPEGVRLLRSDHIEVPIAWGFGRPAVVLPASADTWADDRREAVLLHEMAHLRRRDAWTQVLAQAALSLHWPNPFAWMAYRQFLDAREQACDDAVLQGGARPSAYAEHLVGVARSLQKDRFALAAVAPMARCVPLENRVRSILEVGRQRSQLGRTALGGTVGMALVLLVPLAALRPVADAQEAPSFTMETEVDVEDEIETSVESEMAGSASEVNAAAAEVDAALAEVEAARREIDRLDIGGDLSEARAEIERAKAELDAHRAALDAWRTEEARLDATEWSRVAAELGDEITDAETCTEEALAALKRSGLDLEVQIELRRVLAESDIDFDEARQALVEAATPTRASWSASTISVRATDLETQRAASAARRIALERIGKPTAMVAPTPPLPGAAPRPAAALRPGIRSGSSFDWDAVDRARSEALRRSHS